MVLSQYWYPEDGVPQRRWTWLSELLIQAGHEVTVIVPTPHGERDLTISSWLLSFCTRNSKEQRGPAGENIIRSSYFPAGQSLTKRALNQGVVAVGILWSAAKIHFTTAKFKPDLVIGSVPAIPISLITPLVALVFGSPYVIDLRDAWPELLSERKQWNSETGKRSIRERVLSAGPIQIVGFLLSKLMFRSLESAAGIIVTSKYLEDNLKERFSTKSKTPVFATIRNVFPPRTVVKKAGFEKRPVDTLNVLYAGTLGRAQKLSNALKAVQIARESGVIVNLRLVGVGAATEHLKELIASEGISAVVYSRVSASDLSKHYDWADSALVHLTDWDALQRAIPSKTYELMDLGIHITGVVEGESAELISRLGGGDVVPPESPHMLADLWIDLARNRDRLRVDKDAHDWVQEERITRVPEELAVFLSSIRLNK